MSPVRSVTYVSGPDPEKLVDEKGFEPSANRTAHLSFTAQSEEKCFSAKEKGLSDLTGSHPEEPAENRDLIGTMQMLAVTKIRSRNTCGRIKKRSQSDV